jgi:hypothetical protein
MDGLQIGRLAANGQHQNLYVKSWMEAQVLGPKTCLHLARQGET